MLTMILKHDFEGKKACKEIPGKIYPALKKIMLMTYNADKKSYTVISRGKNFLLQRSGKKKSYPN